MNSPLYYLLSALVCVTAILPLRGLAQTIAATHHSSPVPGLTQAAASGDAETQYQLGVRCRNGDHTARDSRKAAHWFLLAAAQGHRIAQYELGLMYQDGDGGLPRDDRRAIDQYVRSGGQGYEPANLIMGVDYELGDGIPRSRSVAIRYLQQAGQDGMFLAGVLAAAATPARFDGATPLGDYLASLPASPVPARWTTAATADRHAGEPLTLAAILATRRNPRSAHP